MADIFTKEKRSEIMSHVKSKDNISTELKMIEFLKKNKYKEWRRNYPIKGKPDFVFPKKKIALFVDGCFWHGHDCRNIKPQTNKEYWSNKIKNNIKRDIIINNYLENKSYKVIRIWECELKKANLEKLVKAL
jgi:DNA mismatch endonuclease (patch repair protein)